MFLTWKKYDENVVYRADTDFEMHFNYGKSKARGKVWKEESFLFAVLVLTLLLFSFYFHEERTLRYNIRPRKCTP